MAIKGDSVERQGDIAGQQVTLARRTSAIATLQQTAGNRATAALLAMGQARLRVGASNDTFEREADDVAARVVSALAGVSGAGSAQPSGAVTAGVQRRAVVDEAGGELDAHTESLIESARSGGNTLTPIVRRQMESTIGADFSGVRIHTGTAADALNDRVQASAFTIGNDIFFRGGAPDTSSAAGQELMAHELTHTVQQGAATARRSIAPSGRSTHSVQRGGRGKGKKKANPPASKKADETFEIEQPTFGAPAQIPATAKGTPDVAPEAEAEAEAEETPDETPDAVAGAEPKKKLTKGQRKKARLEREQAEADASAKAKQEAEDLAKAERIAAAKKTFEAQEGSIQTLVGKARAAVAPYPHILPTRLNDLVDEIIELKKDAAPDWEALASTLAKTQTEANRIGNLSSIAAEGRLGINLSVMATRKKTDPLGDKVLGERAAVKEALDALGGVGTWNGTVDGGKPGKWGAYHGNGENNLPPGGYKEYYVRPAAGDAPPGSRRIVTHNTTGAIYYSWTHYGKNGNPPFVLLLP